MFFIGGFNTILPHVLYLAIFSIFVFIGLAGRINFHYNISTSQTDGRSVYTSDSYQEANLNPLTFTISDCDQPSDQDLSFILPVKYLNGNYFGQKKIFRPPGYCYYRGPPIKI